MPEDNDKTRNRNAYNLMIAALAAQVGCLTLVIIIAAVLGGIALDTRLGTKPWFTIGLLIISVPISLLLMLYIARRTVSKIKIDQSLKTHEEESIGKDS